MGEKYTVWLRLIIWNHLMWILLNYIEKWNLLEILEVELPYEWKSSALGKNRIFTKIIFQKLSAHDLGVGRFAAFYKNCELVAAFDYDNWHYAIDQYCNFVIVVKSGFFSEKNHSWCHWIFVKTLEKLPWELAVSVKVTVM